jgi:hypothetical protein
LGYEDLEVVQAGPEGAADDGKRDMFEGQEEARRPPTRSPEPACRLV